MNISPNAPKVHLAEPSVVPAGLDPIKHQIILAHWFGVIGGEVDTQHRPTTMPERAANLAA